jgi:hypothetical protein
LTESDTILALLLSYSNEVTDQDFWKKCNSCKKAIGYGALFYVCNVSTCNRKRTGLIFCSVSCWDAHVPMMNHRESWAIEMKAPKKGDPEPDLSPKKEAPPKTETSQEQLPASSSASGPKVILRRQR